MTPRAFRKKIYDYYRREGRALPWRNTRDPYRIFISEIMLQQTQADRVISKYQLFLKRFPTFSALARTTPKEVLTLWQGLGYNRRALYLRMAAITVMETHGGVLPKELPQLLKLKGIGPYTAAALRSFIWNIPEAVIETNIRTVYIHEFFPKKKKVHDRELRPIITRTLDRKYPREWYFALMDYGVMLKKTVGNKSRKSVHYSVQSRFEGSARELRGKIIKILTGSNMRTVKELARLSGAAISSVKKELTRLSKEGFVEEKKGKFFIAK